MALALSCTADDSEQSSSTADASSTSVEPTSSATTTTDPSTSTSPELTGTTSATSSTDPDSSDVGDSTTGADAPGLSEDFEDSTPGQLPNAPWLDVVTRIDRPTVPSPTALVVETTDVDGQPTQAVQLLDAIGTSQGILAEFDPSSGHRVTARVRIDQFSDAPGGPWPIAVGVLQSGPEDDFNLNPHAVIYAFGDGNWYLFVSSGAGGPGALNAVITAPPIVEGTWYALTLEIDAIRGNFRAVVSDPSTGRILGETTSSVAQWDPDFGQYDAVAVFDGEYGTMGTQGGTTVVDDLTYEPVAVE